MEVNLCFLLFIHSFINPVDQDTLIQDMSFSQIHYQTNSSLYTTILLDILHFYTLYITLLHIVNFCLYQ
jgi:hypothetical protein